jgi:O-glycosyl hydrolase
MQFQLTSWGGHSRPARLRGDALLLPMRISVLAILIYGIPGWSDTVTVDVSMSNQTLEGWGSSLSWFANSVGGWTNVKNQISLMNALFNPSSGLGLTYLRYNIGGGDNPNCAANGSCIAPAYHATPGYLAAPGGTYDWTQDANQRRVAKYAQLFGADLIEASSYSPPYWMTISGTSKGGVDGAPNLASQYYGAGRESFAGYLTTVAQHFSDSFGITFHHLDAMNEPGQSWWTSTDTKQEGCGFSLPEQEETIQDVQNSLSSKGLLTQVAAMDENAEGVLNASPGTTAKEFYNYEPVTKGDMTALNTHGYSSSYGSVAIATSTLHYGKRVTMSEWGSSDSTGKDLSNQILTDIYLTRPVAWSIWQPDYPALMTIDYVNQAYTLNEGYYVYANYTKFIRPGFQFIAISDPQSLAAFNQRTRTLVIVTQNWTADSRSVTYQLSNFTTPGSTASVYRTSATEDLKFLGNVSLSNGSFSYTANAGSVTTYVIANASYTPSATTVRNNAMGTGNNQFDYQGSWNYGGQNGAYQSSTSNDYYTFQFSGQQARVYGSMSPQGGIAAFSVDNGAETYFDTFAPLPADNVFLFATPTLANTTHTLKVRVTGFKSPYSIGYQVSVNRIDILTGSAVGPGIYKIVSVNNGLDLEVNSASLADGGKVDTYADVPGANNEHWNLMAVGDGSYRIVNVNSGLDLEVNGASKSNGGIVNQWQDSGSGAINEHWDLVAIGDGSYRIVNVNSGLDLEVNGTTGVVDQYQDVPGANNEHWSLIPTN